jgi:FdhD protein
VEKINIDFNTRKMVKESVAMEAPVNIFVNNEYVITLLATPELRKELALGWLFDEGVLESFSEVLQVEVTQDRINVISKQPITGEKLKVSGVSRLLTTACGLSVKKFLEIISETSWQQVTSEYTVKAEDVVEMAKKLDESKLYLSTGGGHVSAIFEEGRFVALAEDVGRHNTIDKVVGIGIQSKINFFHSVLVCSGRQPADMVLKAARMQIPIVVSQAAPIRSGIIAAEKTGVTLVCFVRNQQMNVYTHHRRILTSFQVET